MTRPDAARPHALYVAWGYPPSRGGGVYRALATANGLVDAGFRVTVLTCEREAFVRYTGVDPSLEDEIDPSITVVRLPFEWPAREVDIRRWPAERAKDPIGWQLRRNDADREHFPETGYGSWAGPLAAEAEAIHARDPVDLVVGTANPNVDMVPALVLHRKHQVPFVYDHRDAWTLDVFTEDEANTDDPRVAQLESELVASAEEVWFVNEPISAWHRDRYPNHAAKIVTVPNGYDEQFAPVADAPTGAVDRVRFGYLGTITPFVPMAEFLAGWREATGAAAMAGATADFWGYLGFYGTPHGGLAAQFADAQAEGLAVTYRGSVPKTGVAETYANVDALLLVLASGRFVTSGKVYEYMSSGLPIVSVHDPAIDASRVMAGYPAWFPAKSLEPAAVADALVGAAEAIQSGAVADRADCRAFAERYERRRILRPRLESLRALFPEQGVR